MKETSLCKSSVSVRFIQLTVVLQICMAAAIDKSFDWNYEGAAAAEQQSIPVVAKWIILLMCCEGFICGKLKLTPLAAGGHHHPSLLWTSKRRSSKFEARRLPLLSNITVNAGAGRDTGHKQQSVSSAHCQERSHRVMSGDEDGGGDLWDSHYGVTDRGEQNSFVTKIAW